MTPKEKQAAFHRRHARRRCRQRLGFKLTTKLENQIVNAIKNDVGVTFIKRSSRTRRLLDVDLHSQIIRVVYSSSMEQIITVFKRNPLSDVR